MHTDRIYTIGSNLQILQTALVNSACVLTMFVSLSSFSLIVYCTISIFKSEDGAGQVIPGIFFLIFHSRVYFELCVGAMLLWNIMGFSRKVLPQLSLNLLSEFQYYLKFVREFLCHHTFCSPKLRTSFSFTVEFGEPNFV